MYVLSRYLLHRFSDFMRREGLGEAQTLGESSYSPILYRKCVPNNRKKLTSYAGYAALHGGTPLGKR